MNPSSRHKLISAERIFPGDSGDLQGEADNEDAIKNRQKPQSHLLKKKLVPSLTAPVALSTLRALKRLRGGDHGDGQPGGSRPEERLASSDSGHGQAAQKEKHAPRAGESPHQETIKDEGHEELTCMIGYLSRYALEDWTLVVEVCDRASTSKDNAKEAVRALRHEFKYGKPPTQLSAARLWAIMLRNSSDVFIIQSTSGKFLGTIERLLRSGQTSPVVRERLLDVVAAAAYASGSETGSDQGFKRLWRRIKPSDRPDEGVPFDMDDAMFDPPESGYISRYVVRDRTVSAPTGISKSNSSTHVDISAPEALNPRPQMQYQPLTHAAEKSESLSSPNASRPSSRPPLPLPHGAPISTPYGLVPGSTGAVPPFDLKTPATLPPRYSQLFGIDEALGECQYGS